MEFWKENPGLRVGLMLLTFLAGLALLFYGWGLTGKLSGLGSMLVGVALLLCTLWLYNRAFQDPKNQ